MAAPTPDASWWNITEAVKRSGPVDLSKPYETASLAGKSILITGGASGFGAAFARKWASHGAHVFLADVNDAAGEAIVAELRELPGSSKHHYYQHCDVTKWEDQVALFKKAVESSPTGGIDAVIVNAGVVEKESAVTGKGFENPAGLDEDHPAPPSLAVLNVNLTGAMYTTHLALFWLPRNGARPDGTPRDRHIVLTSSIAGLSPLPGQPEYTAAKHALVGLFRSLRGSVWRQGIRCNLIAPYFVATPLIPSRALLFSAGGDLAAIDDVVDATTRLVADESIRGRGLAIGPKLKAVANADGDLELVAPEDDLRGYVGKIGSQAVWDVHAEDYERVDLFVWRFVGALNLVVKIKGFVGLVKAVFAIFTSSK